VTRSLQPDQVDALLRAAGPDSTVYLVGAGGCGMSGLGHLLLDLGHRVAGSDLVINEEVRQLRARGACIRAGHDEAAVRAAQPVLLAYTAAVGPGHPELEVARRMDVPVVRRAILLAALLHRHRGICVAGMHGKTTTTALLAFAMLQLGLRPGYAIGALVPQLPRHAHFSDFSANPQRWLAIEADESDGTLRCFRPEHAILLNVDAEHLDHFRNLDAICSEFLGFAGQVQGLRLYCKDDPRLCAMLDGQPRALSFGFDSAADYQVECGARPEEGLLGVKSARSESQGFAVRHQGKSLGRFTTLLPGKQNLENVAAVIALLHQLGFDPEPIARAIAAFRGAARRQELLFADGRLRVFDDYGHHPTEIRATLQALRPQAAGRLVVAFQPHRYTRTRHLLAQFATCFADADELWLTEIYPASEAPIPGITGLAMAQAIRAHGQAVHYVLELDQLGAAVLGAARAGDLVLFLGAGDITRVAHEVAAACGRGEPGVGVPAAGAGGRQPGERPTSAGLMPEGQDLGGRAEVLAG
jgi:UDP-N-acetylmuramate--alanine ligase